MPRILNVFLGGTLILMLPAQINAQADRPASPSVRMWNDVYVGMSREDFKSIYANHKGEISPGCPIAVLGRFKNGKLITLYLEDISKNDKFFLDEKKRLTNLLGIGEYEVKKISRGYSIGGYFTSYQTMAENTTWKDGPLTIKYFSVGNVGSPSIYYTVRTDGKF